MKKQTIGEKKNKEQTKEMAEKYYKKAMRVLEYYVLLCFILITFIPLLDYSWVPGFTKFIYMTGFPLLIFLFIVSIVKEPILNLISKFIEN